MGSKALAHGRLGESCHAIRARRNEDGIFDGRGAEAGGEADGQEEGAMKIPGLPSDWKLSMNIPKTKCYLIRRHDRNVLTCYLA